MVGQPPDELHPAFDLHGVRVEVRPRAERSPRMRLLFGGVAGGVSLAGVAATGLVASRILARSPDLSTIAPTLIWLAVPLVWLGVFWAALLVLAFADHARESERLGIRLGEGWLIVRGAVTETRIDLTAVRALRVEAGPVLRVALDGGGEGVIPMAGHGLEAASWLAEAVEAAARDARRGERPAPEHLVALRRGAVGAGEA